MIIMQCNVGAQKARMKNQREARDDERTKSFRRSRTE
jgi:hypothetical protein